MPFPTQEQNPAGLHLRYIVSKANGLPVDANADYLVFRIDDGGSDPIHIAAGRAAGLMYAAAIERHLPQVAADIRARIPAAPSSIVESTAAARNTPEAAYACLVEMADIFKPSHPEFAGNMAWAAEILRPAAASIEEGRVEQEVQAIEKSRQQLIDSLNERPASMPVVSAALYLEQTGLLLQHLWVAKHNLYNATAAATPVGEEAGGAGAEAFGFIKVGDPEDVESLDWNHESEDAAAMCLFANGSRMVGWYQQNDNNQECIAGHWCWREGDGDGNVYWSPFTPQPTHFLPELGTPHLSHAPADEAAA